MVLDTNILIYSTKPGGDNLRPWVDDPNAIVSIVTRIEALGFSGISAQEEAAIERALRELPETALTDAVAVRAISLRQERKMSLADAIIAATALTHNLPLVTRNVDDFKHINGLKIINPFATS
jgi:toxin FitB